MVAIAEGLDCRVVFLLQSGKALEGLPIGITESDRRMFSRVSYARLHYILGLDNPSAGQGEGSIILRSISPSGMLEACIGGEIVRRHITDAGYKESNGAYVPA